MGAKDRIFNRRESLIVHRQLLNGCRPYDVLRRPYNLGVVVGAKDRIFNRRDSLIVHRPLLNGRRPFESGHMMCCIGLTISEY
jgi:hypothetical protein